MRQAGNGQRGAQLWSNACARVRRLRACSQHACQAEGAVDCNRLDCRSGGTRGPRGRPGRLLAQMRGPSDARSTASYLRPGARPAQAVHSHCGDSLSMANTHPGHRSYQPWANIGRPRVSAQGSLVAMILPHLLASVFPGWFWHPLGECSGTHAEYLRCRSYNWWSGAASDISEITLPIGVAAFYLQHTCKASRWCPRWAHHKVDGTTASVCHVHHTRGHHHKLQLRHRRKYGHRLGHGEST
jgi:hypothetical protein